MVLLDEEISKPVYTKIIIYPDQPWKMALGCEDPRVFKHRGRYYILYTGVAPEPDHPERKPIIGISKSYRSPRTCYLG